MPRYIEERERNIRPKKEKPLNKLSNKVLADKLASLERRHTQALSMDVTWWIKMGLSEAGWKADIMRISESIDAVRKEIERRNNGERK